MKSLSLNEWLDTGIDKTILDLIGVKFKRPAPRIVCVDGLSLSVQTSALNYCTPRDNKGPYTEVELGYPSETPPQAILDYAEEPDRPTETIYPYVPIELVTWWIAAHGGISQESLKRHAETYGNGSPDCEPKT